MRKNLNNFWPVYFVLVVLVAVRFLPLAVGTTWLWGVGQLSLLPLGYRVGYGLLGAVALALPLLPQSINWGESISGWLSNLYYESKAKYLVRGLTVLAVGTLFSILTMPTHFLGDGYTYLANISSSSGHFLKWSEAGSMWVVLALQSILGAKSEATALLAFQMMSIGSGMIAFWFYFLIARTISDNAVVRLITLCAIAFSSTLLMFFGYVESYPILWGPVAGFFYFSLRYSTEGKGIGASLACLAVATLLHLQIGMYYPAVGFLLLSRGTGLALYRRFRPAIWSIGTLCVIGGIVVFVRRLTSDLAFENAFLISVKPSKESYTLFSARHLVDMINLLGLVSPGMLLFLGLSFDRWRRRILEPTSVFLGLLTIGSMLFLFLIDPGLGMPRDWDLFALCGLAPTLWFLNLAADSNSAVVKRLSIGICIALIAFTFPFLAVNLNEKRSIEYAKQIIDNNPDESFGTLSLLETYYRDHGDQQRLDSLTVVRKARYSDFYQTVQAFHLLHTGQLDSAEITFKTIKPNKFSKDYHSFLAEVALRKGRIDSAIYHAEACIQLQPYVDRSYTTIGSAYLLNHEPAKALEKLKRGYALNEQSVPILIGIAAAHLALGNYDSTLAYCRTALTRSPDVADAYYIMAQAYVGLGQEQEAAASGKKFLEIGPGTEGFEMYRTVLIRLLPQLETAEGANGVGSVPAK